MPSGSCACGLADLQRLRWRGNGIEFLGQWRQADGRWAASAACEYSSATAFGDANERELSIGDSGHERFTNDHPTKRGKLQRDCI